MAAGSGRKQCNNSKFNSMNILRHLRLVDSKWVPMSVARRVSPYSSPAASVGVPWASAVHWISPSRSRARPRALSRRYHQFFDGCPHVRTRCHQLFLCVCVTPSGVIESAYTRITGRWKIMHIVRFLVGTAVASSAPVLVVSEGLLCYISVVTAARGARLFVSCAWAFEVLGLARHPSDVRRAPIRNVGRLLID